MEGRPAGAGRGQGESQERETSTSLTMARSAQISYTWPGHTWACCPACRLRDVRAKDCRHSTPLPPLAPFCGSFRSPAMALLECSVSCRVSFQDRGRGARVHLRMPTLSFLPILSNSGGAEAVGLKLWLTCKGGGLSKKQQINHG